MRYESDQDNVPLKNLGSSVKSFMYLFLKRALNLFIVLKVNKQSEAKCFHNHACCLFCDFFLCTIDVVCLNRLIIQPTT